jgi:hypothetical protein
MPRKKGTVIDFLFIVLVMMVFAIVAIVSIYLWDSISTPLKNAFGIGEATDVINTSARVFGVMDYIFLFLFFGLSIAPLIFAFLVQTHPVFFVVNILLLIVLFLIMPTISNVVRSFWATDQFAPYAAGGSGSVTYTIMTRVFQYLPFITGGLSIILTIAMFVKPREL